MRGDPTQTRGYRNRNPGNIEHVAANRWLGLDNPPSDGRFCRFVEHCYGIRALAVLLMAYHDRHGCDTVRKIINRWAPEHENPTRNYVTFVAREVGVGPDDTLSVHDPQVMFGLVTGIIRFELGGMPYSDREIWSGLELAGFRRPQPLNVIEAAATDTGKGVLVTTVAAAGSVFSQVEPVIEVLGRLPWQVAIAVLVMVALTMLLWRARRR